MLGLQLRDEFRGKRLKGTTVDFKNQSGTGALDQCPHCGEAFIDAKAYKDGESARLGRPDNKRVTLSLFVTPTWLSGDTLDPTSSIATEYPRWLATRQAHLSLVEFRGKLPDSFVDPSGNIVRTGREGGTMPKNAHFACQESTCGKEQTVLSAMESYGNPSPIAPYSFQGVCLPCKEEGDPLGGKFFDTTQMTDRYLVALAEWEAESSRSLAHYWPTDPIPYGSRTHVKDPLPKHGYTHWHHLFNARQLLILARLVSAITSRIDQDVPIDLVCGVFQQYLRNQNLFCFWNTQRALEPMFSNNNFNPKNTSVENSVFSGIGRGDFSSCGKKLIEAIEWLKEPSEIASEDGSSSTKVPIGNGIEQNVILNCSSATQLTGIEDCTQDLVITDPPFGGILQYAELADFFYVWLRVLLHEKYPGQFGAEATPKALEAVANETRHPDDADDFYQRILTQCWIEAARVLKPSGLLVFTFHHSEDEPWIAVLESLFQAGFILEATYPIRSDESKGDGQFGSQKIEFDIIHVCRKRLIEPDPISWARLRQRITRDIRQLQEIIEQYQQEGLGEADLQVIRRGKALEYYSRHYGKVYIEKGQEDAFTVKDALVGINQLLDDESDTTSESPPVLAEPYTRQFLRLFADKRTLERDQMQKYLRGTGVSPSEFLERGWCNEEKKVFTMTSPLEWAQQWKGKARKGMSRDFDQTFFLIGACYDVSGIKASDTLNSGSFVPHPAIGDLLDWFGKHGSDNEMKSAARRAKQIYSTWLAKNTKQVVAQLTLFDLEDDE